MKVHGVHILCVAFLSWLAAADARAALIEDRWVSIGPIYRSGMTMIVRGSSIVQEQGLSSMSPANRVPGRLLNGPVQDRFLWLPRPSTFEPLGPGIIPIPWEAGKSAEGQRVVVTPQLDTSFGLTKQFDGYGTEVEMGYIISTGERDAWGLVFGVAGIWNARASLRGTSYKEDVSVRDVRVTETKQGLELFVRGPGGDQDAFPRALIHSARGSRSEQVVGSQQWEAYNEARFDINMDLYELWVGPRLFFQATDAVQVYFTPKISINFVDLEVDRMENFSSTQLSGVPTVIGNFRDSVSERTWLFGAGATAGASLDLENGFFIGAFAGYEWVSGDIHASVGPNSVTVDPSGYTLGTVMGMRFASLLPFGGRLFGR